MIKPKGSIAFILLVILLIPGGTYWYLEENVFSQDSKKEIELKAREDENTKKVKSFVEIRMTPTEIENGGSFKLQWNTRGVVSCVASSPTAPELPFKMEWDGEIPLNGEKYYSGVPHSLIFDLNCKTESGENISQSKTLGIVDKDSKKPATIKVNAPNGNETYRLGKDMLIRWKSENTNIDIDIDLLKEDGTVLYNLVSGLNSMTGSQLDSFGPSFSWPLPITGSLGDKSLEPGKYKIRIKFVGESGIADTSDEFFTVIK